MRVFFLYLLPLGLWLWAIIDCAIDDDVQRTGLPKGAWLLLIIVVPYLGALAWIIVSKIARPPLNSPPRRPRPAPLAPDDNVDYLRRLAEEQARRRRLEERRNKPKDDQDDADAADQA
jgi:hypothetical protein